MTDRNLLKFKGPKATPFEKSSLHELDCVELIEEVRYEEQIIPRLSKGTIVDWVESSGYCEVEFVKPFPCVLTLEKNKLKKIDDISIRPAR